MTRTVYPEVPPRVEYSLTDLGKALGPSMTALIDWAFLRRETLGLDGSQWLLKTRLNRLNERQESLLLFTRVAGPTPPAP